MEAKAARRIAHLVSTLQPELQTENKQEMEILTQNPTSGMTKSDDDVVIVCSLRTAIGRAKRGNFKDTHLTDLLSAVLKGVIDKTKIDPKLIEDVCVGTVLPPGGGATQARMALFLAGFPETTAIQTVNRQCSSGLQAVANIVGEIRNGFISIGIAAGVESMSSYDMASSVGELNPKIFQNINAQNCLMSMGDTSENVAEKYGITREEQDKFAFESQRRALQAQKEGRFKAEIIPVTTVVKTPEGDKTVTVSQDEGVRPTTMESLTKLKPAFRPNGSSTAGNSSQVSDGAAASLLMRRSMAKKLGLPVFGTFRSFAVVGVPPEIMGVGPAEAIPVALKKAGLKVDDIDVYEINEAFASQAFYSAKKLSIPLTKVNPNGGAIALGHPLGCTGVRQIATLLHELKRTNGRFGVVSMCIGTGMGAAAVIELD